MANASLVFREIGNNVSERFRATVRSRIGLFRVLTQTVSLILLSGGALGLASTWLPLPVSYPRGAPYSVFWDGFEALQYILAYGYVPFLTLGIFLLFSITIGRMSCGWLCPVGFFQDILSWLPIKKIKPSRPDNSFGNAIKYFIAATALSSAAIIGLIRQGGDEVLVAGFKTDIPYSLFDPAGTLFATFYYYITWGIYPANGSVFTAIAEAGTYTIIRVLIFLFVMMAAIKIPRFYCRYLCPTGAMLGIMSHRSIIGIKKDAALCQSGCNECEQACPMMVPLVDLSERYVQDRSCINCGKCVDACPNGAMTFGVRV